MKILMAAGGTGGHIYPGIAIADRLKETFPDAEIIFVGSHVGMERDIVPKAGYALELIRARGFERGISRETFEAIKGVFDSMADAQELLEREKPGLVIGTGGFTSAMLLYRAAKLGIPTMIHEQNAYPGRSNRLTGMSVDRVAISFPQASRYFREGKTFLAGNPVREVFKDVDRDRARERLGIKPGQRLVAFMGGSQGAQSINKAAVYAMRNWRLDNTVFYHLTGNGQIEMVRDSLESAGVLNPSIKLFGYYNDVATLLSAADLVVSRSGAMSVAEIAACATPSILVPYPKAAGDHQTFNARVLSEAGAAVLVPDAELTGEGLLELAESILSDPETVEGMRSAARGQRILDADVRFCEEAKKLVDSYNAKKSAT